jgi:hypothetical protein
MRGCHALAGIAERITNREAQQHAADPVGRNRARDGVARSLQQGGSGET